MKQAYLRMCVVQLFSTTVPPNDSESLWKYLASPVLCVRGRGWLMGLSILALSPSPAEQQASWPSGPMVYNGVVFTSSAGCCTRRTSTRSPVSIEPSVSTARRRICSPHHHAETLVHFIGLAPIHASWHGERNKGYPSNGFCIRTPAFIKYTNRGLPVVIALLLLPRPNSLEICRNQVSMIKLIRIKLRNWIVSHF